MLLGLQSFVRQRFSSLAMAMVAAGFLLLLLEMIGYNHFGGLQIVGTGAVVIGLIASVLGIGAHGRLRSILIGLFLVLALAGLLGEWEHNEERLEGERGPAAGQEAPAPQGETEADQQSGPGGSEEEIPPPILAPLSVSGLCLFGSVLLLARREPDEQQERFEKRVAARG
jgi:hypothetical protein